MIDLAPKVEDVKKNAIAFAEKRGHAQATPDHLLYALTNDTHAYSVLRAFEIDAKELQDAIKTYLNFIEPQSLQSEAKPTPTKPFNEILDQAERFSKSAIESDSPHDPETLLTVNILVAYLIHNKNIIDQDWAEKGKDKDDIDGVWFSKDDSQHPVLFLNAIGMNIRRLNRFQDGGSITAMRAGYTVVPSTEIAFAQAKLMGGRCQTNLYNHRPPYIAFGYALDVTEHTQEYLETLKEAGAQRPRKGACKIFLTQNAEGGLKIERGDPPDYVDSLDEDNIAVLFEIFREHHIACARQIITPDGEVLFEKGQIIAMYNRTTWEYDGVTTIDEARRLVGLQPKTALLPLRPAEQYQEQPNELIS